MSDEDDILVALHLAGERRIAGFLLSEHALERMFQRQLRRADVSKALTEVSHVARQGNGTWKATGGSDIDDDPLVLIVSVTNGVVIVTLF